MKRILITRPREQAEALAAKLEAKGYAPLIEPLLEVEIRTGNAMLLDVALMRNPLAILVTSRQAVEAAAKLSGRRDVPLLCVGEATADYAKEKGFTVAGFCETAAGLAELTESHFPPGSLLYLRGEQVSRDLATELSPLGFTLSSLVLYRAVAATSLSDALCSSIAKGELAGALFFSQRTAEVYAELAQSHALESKHRALTAVCMSAPVSHKLSSLPWKSLKVAAKPDERNMLNALEAAV